MTRKFTIALVAVTTAVILPVCASAQERLDYGTTGYFGGYSNFGGYYDTYGAYGGRSAYGNYNRSKELPITSSPVIATIPVGGGADPANVCSYTKRKAQQTHSKVWRARYAACLRDKN